MCGEGTTLFPEDPHELQMSMNTRDTQWDKGSPEGTISWPILLNAFSVIEDKEAGDAGN